MAIYQVQSRYDGFPGSPGFNTVFFIGEGETDNGTSTIKAAAAHSLWANFMTAFAADPEGMPDAIDWTVLPEIVARNPVTGAGITTFSEPAVSGSGTPLGDLLPSANGLVVTWRSSVFGPRGRGRSFMPPGREGASTGGVPISGAVTALQTAADNLITASIANAEVTMVVWHRPTPQAPTGGTTGTVGSASVRAQWAVLRSRRD